MNRVRWALYRQVHRVSSHSPVHHIKIYFLSIIFHSSPHYHPPFHDSWFPKKALSSWQFRASRLLLTYKVSLEKCSSLVNVDFLISNCLFLSKNTSLAPSASLLSLCHFPVIWDEVQTNSFIRTFRTPFLLSSPFIFSTANPTLFQLLSTQKCLNSKRPTSNCCNANRESRPSEVRVPKTKHRRNGSTALWPKWLRENCTRRCPDGLWIPIRSTPTGIQSTMPVSQPLLQLSTITEDSFIEVVSFGFFFFSWRDPKESIACLFAIATRGHMFLNDLFTITGLVIESKIRIDWWPRKLFL